VRTASMVQVRQPAHTRSVGRWKHYEELLHPLFRALERHRVIPDNCERWLSKSVPVAQLRCQVLQVRPLYEARFVQPWNGSDRVSTHPASQLAELLPEARKPSAPAWRRARRPASRWVANHRGTIGSAAWAKRTNVVRSWRRDSVRASAPGWMRMNSGRSRRAAQPGRMMVEEVAESTDAHNMAQMGALPCLSMFVEIFKRSKPHLILGQPVATLISQRDGRNLGFEVTAMD